MTQNEIIAQNFERFPKNGDPDYVIRDVIIANEIDLSQSNAIETIKEVLLELQNDKSCLLYQCSDEAIDELLEVAKQVIKEPLYA